MKKILLLSLFMICMVGLHAQTKTVITDYELKDSVTVVEVKTETTEYDVALLKLQLENQKKDLEDGMAVYIHNVNLIIAEIEAKLNSIQQITK